MQAMCGVTSIYSKEGHGLLDWCRSLEWPPRSWRKERKTLAAALHPSQDIIYCLAMEIICIQAGLILIMRSRSFGTLPFLNPFTRFYRLPALV